MIFFLSTFRTRLCFSGGLLSLLTIQTRTPSLVLRVESSLMETIRSSYVQHAMQPYGISYASGSIYTSGVQPSSLSSRPAVVAVV